MCQSSRLGKVIIIIILFHYEPTTTTRRIGWKSNSPTSEWLYWRPYSGHNADRSAVQRDWSAFWIRSGPKQAWRLRASILRRMFCRLEFVVAAGLFTPVPQPPSNQAILAETQLFPFLDISANVHREKNEFLIGRYYLLRLQETIKARPHLLPIFQYFLS